MTAVAGFFGKLPARGDFVRHGLPPDFLRTLDAWWQVVLSDSRTALGEGWTEAWMEAPVWHFAFAAGVCGAGAAVGLWLPSTDKAGRLFPLTIAAVGDRWRDVARCTGFLAEAEAIGYRVLEDDTDPDQLGAAIATVFGLAGDPIEEPPSGGGLWWTSGSPLVAAITRRVAGMPDSKLFAAMLRDEM